MRRLVAAGFSTGDDLQGAAAVGRARGRVGGAGKPGNRTARGVTTFLPARPLIHPFNFSLLLLSRASFAEDCRKSLILLRKFCAPSLPVIPAFWRILDLWLLKPACDCRAIFAPVLARTNAHLPVRKFFESCPIFGAISGHFQHPLNRINKLAIYLSINSLLTNR